MPTSVIDRQKQITPMFVSKETSDRILSSQRSMSRSINRLQALVQQSCSPELGEELSRLAGSHHQLVGLVRAVLDAVTEDADPRSLGSEPPSDA